MLSAHRGTQRRIHGRPREEQADSARLLQPGVQRQEAHRGGGEVRRTALHPAQPPSPDGFEAFIQFVLGFVEQFPQLSLDIKRTVAEGDLVVTHSLIKTSPEDRGTAAADFFRLEDGKIVEHWDVLQPVPESAANDHPMF
jgi:predicted SnoaL-like aldol condensation-catalyzing enzyme